MPVRRAVSENVVPSVGDVTGAFEGKRSKWKIEFPGVILTRFQGQMPTQSEEFEFISKRNMWGRLSNHRIGIREPGWRQFQRRHWLQP